MDSKILDVLNQNKELLLLLALVLILFIIISDLLFDPRISFKKIKNWVEHSFIRKLINYIWR